MFYDNSNWTFRITGIFYYERDTRDVSELGRTHTAISYRIQGSSTFYTNGQALPAGTGDIAYIPPGVAYRHKNDTAEKVIILHLHTLGPCDDRIQVIPHAQELESMFRQLLESWEEGTGVSYNRSMSQLYRIFEALQHKQARQEPPVPPAIAPGIELMRRSFRDPRLTVGALSQACFVSEVYFRRVYRAYAGQSPLQAILELRFRYARELLRSGYYSPKQAAEAAGFSDVKYFRVAFKKRYGQTPSQYLEENVPDGPEGAQNP